MEIDVGYAVSILIASLVLGVLGQSIRIGLQLIKERLKPPSQGNAKLLGLINDGLKEIDAERKKQKVHDPKLMEQKRLYNTLKRHHKDIYKDEDRGFSLLLSLPIGAAAGVFYTISGFLNNNEIKTAFEQLYQLHPQLTLPVIVSIITIMVAGYVGPDFIDDFVKGNKITFMAKEK